MKYSWKFKLECVNKYKKGETINFPGIPKGEDSFMGQARICDSSMLLSIFSNNQKLESRQKA